MGSRVNFCAGRAGGDGVGQPVPGEGWRVRSMTACT
jgi:hypothetical protein